MTDENATPPSTEVAEKKATVAEYVLQYNELARSAAGVALGAKPIIKFRDLATAQKRLEALTRATEEWNEGQEASQSKEEGASEEPAAEEEGASEEPAAEEEEKPPRKRAKKKKAAATTAEDAESKPSVDDTEETTMSAKQKAILEKFDSREGSKQAKALMLLCSNLGKQVGIERIATKVYGAAAAKKNGSTAVKAVLSGIEKATKGTGTVLKMEGRGKEATYGLHSTAR
jgi:hypothetical protein